MDITPSAGPPIPNPPAGYEQGQKNNVVMAVLAYLGILIIIPLVTDARHDPLVKFHVKQGLVLIIGWVIAAVLGRIPLIGIFAGLLDVGLVILTVLGIVSAASGKQKPLPVVGGFAENFRF